MTKNTNNQLLRALFLLLIIFVQPTSAFFHTDWISALLGALFPPSNSDGNSSSSNTPNNDNAVYISCGSAFAATDSKGQEWQADNFFTNGVSTSLWWTSWFDQDGSIFQTMRQAQSNGESVKYVVPLPAVANQKVALTLYFAERWDFWMWLTGATDHIDIDVQKKNVKSNMALKADGSTAPRTLRMESEAVVSKKGQLIIEIRSSGNNKAALSAIEIHALADDDGDNGNVETDPTDVPATETTTAPVAAVTKSPVAVAPIDAPITSAPVAAVTKSPVARPPTDSPIVAVTPSPVAIKGATKVPVPSPTSVPVPPPIAVSSDKKIFKEEGSIVMMEAEHASTGIASPWVLSTDKKGFGGEGYLHFTGNSVQGGEAKGYMSYFFYITNPGRYTMKLHSNKLHEDGTLANDCYTRLVDYPDVQGNLLKTFQPANPGWWNWQTKLEVIHHEDVRVPKYELEADRVYELQIAGRSKDFLLDRIVIYKMTVLSPDVAEAVDFPESSLLSGDWDEPVAPPMEAPVQAPVSPPAAGAWIEVDSAADLVARHEACFVFDEVTRKGYLLGGRYRGDNRVNIYDPSSRNWSAGASPPIELHHMQCVAADGKIWIVSSWTGNYPQESNTEDIHIYDPAMDSWSKKAGLPEHRRRGGAAAVLVGRRIYVSHGNRGGHERGDGDFAVTLGWLDYYDLDKDQWTTELPDAPNPRDHTGGALVNGKKLCVAGGRDGGTDGFFNLVILPTDCYNLDTGEWSVEADIPQGRAGSSYGTTCDGKLMIAGGEGFGQAFSDVDVFDGHSWTSFADLNVARHGSGLAVDCKCNQIHIASGSGGQGGGSEIRSVETYFPGGVDATCST